MITVSSKILIIFGILILSFGGYLIFEHYTPKRLSFNNFRTSSVSGSRLPGRIIIPSLNIDLAILPSKITNNKWEVTNQGISYLSSSPSPGEKGNSILYGHNWTSLLGRLPKIKPGAEINIAFNNKERKTFIVEYVSVVDSHDTQVIANTNDKRITLYTCTGFLDSKRFVVTATLLSPIPKDQLR